MNHKHLTFGFELKAVEDDGFFSGYLAVFEELDSYRDVIKPGAFTKTIADWKAKNRRVPVLWQHNTSEPIGVFTEMKEDSYGLYVEGSLLVADVQRAREAHALMKAGAINGMSIGYMVARDERDPKSNVRRLFEVDLFEGSIVTFPAIDSARVTEVRSIVEGDELPDLKTFERFLREAGFSKSQAAAVVSRGYAYLSRSESVDADEKINGFYDSIIHKLKKESN